MGEEEAIVAQESGQVDTESQESGQVDTESQEQQMEDAGAQPGDQHSMESLLQTDYDVHNLRRGQIVEGVIVQVRPSAPSRKGSFGGVRSNVWGPKALQSWSTDRPCLSMW